MQDLQKCYAAQIASLLRASFDHAPTGMDAADLAFIACLTRERAACLRGFVRVEYHFFHHCRMSWNYWRLQRLMGEGESPVNCRTTYNKAD